MSNFWVLTFLLYKTTHLSFVVGVACKMTQQEIEQGRENLPQRLGRVTHDHLPDVQRRLKQINEWINQYSRYRTNWMFLTRKKHILMVSLKEQMYLKKIIPMCPLRPFKYFLAWSSLVIEESLACQITSHSTISWVVFENKIKKIALKNNLTFCWMGKLSGKPVTPLLSKELHAS